MSADATGIWRQRKVEIMAATARNDGSDGFPLCLVDRDGGAVDEQGDGGGGASTATISFLACAVLMLSSPVSLYGICAASKRMQVDVVARMRLGRENTSVNAEGWSMNPHAIRIMLASKY